VSGPDFIDLVGDDGSQEELEQLRRAHDLLLAAGPPPELSPRIAEAPAEVAAPKRRLPRKRRGTAFLLAAGIAAAAFGVGLLIGNRGSGDFPTNQTAKPMHPPSASGTARGSLLVGERDSAGNWPLLVRASGLRELRNRDYYEVFLVRGQKIRLFCGSFNQDPDGRIEVRFTVPYRIKEGDRWIVVTSERPKREILTT
jgi:hypothetical protein